jgi:transposase-like protein
MLNLIRKIKNKNKGTTPMKKIRPSEKKINRNENLLKGKEFGGFDDLVVKIAEGIIQKSLENEVTEQIGRDWYKRSSIETEKQSDREEEPETEEEQDRSRKVYRNGYYPRRINTIDGRMDLEIPRLRNSEEKYESKILKNLVTLLKEKLQKVVMEAIVRGLSYRDVEECFTDTEGEAIISRSSMTEIMEGINKEFEEFRKSDLSEQDIVYLYFDGVYESVKKYTNNQTILCCWGVSSTGDKLLLGLAGATSESEVSWNDFMESLLDRGLRQPLLVISDGNKGLIKAIAKSFPLAKRQRCIAHKMRNILNKLPQEAQSRIKMEVHSIYYAYDATEAESKSEEFIRKHSNKYPEMIRCFTEDLPACLEHLKFPESHRKFIRTTNLIERAFVEEKRRTKIIPYHQNEKGMMNLVFGVLIRASRKWRKMKISAFDKTILFNIRKIIIPNYQDTSFVSYNGAA